MSMFSRYGGIDYSGKGKPTRAYSGIQVYMASSGNPPARQQRPNSAVNWSRESLAEWLVGILEEPTPTIVGIDHAFSFPVDFLHEHRIANWEEFLPEFCKHWPADKQAVNDLKKGNQLLGYPNLLRLTDRKTRSAKSVFRFGVNGQVATSTHAGIPWLKHLRSKLGNHVHFWPFDGFTPTLGRSVVAEVYPRLFRQCFNRPCGLSNDEYDAWMTCSWLRDNDLTAQLSTYLAPSLSSNESATVQIEGWILGLL